MTAACCSLTDTMLCHAVLDASLAVVADFRTCHVSMVPPQDMLPTNNTGKVLSHEHGGAAARAIAAALCAAQQQSAQLQQQNRLQECSSWQ